MATIRGYELTTEWTNSANGSFAFCTKKGKEYFIKKFPNPKYPNKSDYSESSYKRIVANCDCWLENQEKIIDALKKSASKCGYIIAPEEVFREGADFYKVSEKVTLPRVKEYTEIAKEPKEIRIDLIKKYLTALSALESQNIVHGDLKHSNVFIVKVGSKLEPRIIDFDDSYFCGNPPCPEETIGSMEYYSPELGYYIVSEDESKKNIVTCKSDIFAAGLMIHEYYTGARVKHSTRYPFQVKRETDIYLSPAADGIKVLLKEMLKKDRENRPTALEAIKILEGGKPTSPIKTTEEDKPRAPMKERIIQVSPTECKYIDIEGKESVIAPFVAKTLAKRRKITIESAEEKPKKVEETVRGPAPTITPAGDLTPLGNTIISRTETTVTVRYKDGSETAIPKGIFDNMCKRGKI